MLVVVGLGAQISARVDPMLGPFVAYVGAIFGPC